MSSSLLVSVIVPFYNVERYLHACLHSVQLQSYKNLQVICVDDGSTDSSKDVAQSFAQSDSRFLLIEKEHGGVSDSRNVGLSACLGDYIMFVDSDDVVSVDIVCTMLEEAQKSNADIVVCGYRRFEGDGVVFGASSQEEVEFRHYSGEDAYLKSYQGRNTQMNVIWGKLYRSHLFEGIRYPQGLIHEDEFVTYKLVVAARVVSMTDHALVFYRKRPGSIMEQTLSQENLVALDAFHERLKYFICLQNHDLVAQAADYYIAYISWFYCDLKSEDLRRGLYCRYREAFKTYKEYLNGVQRMRRILFLLSPLLFSMLYRLASSTSS